MEQRVGLLFKCEWCGAPIEKAAGSLFSPPIDNMTRSIICVMNVMN